MFNITGSGTVETADINASNVVFEKEPQKMNVAEGVEEPTIKGTPSPGGGGSGRPTKVAVSAISVTPETMILGVGGTGTITGTVEPGNATNKTITWTTSDASVATVANGVVTARTAGTTTITATAGSKTATCTVNVYAESSAGDFDFNEGTKTITGYNGSGGVVVIPSKINGVDVETIGEDAFYNCNEITNIVIPNSVTSIEAAAFANCTDLSSVTFQETSQVTTIGDSAFYQCASLASITIPNTVTSIGEDVAGGCTVFDGCTRLQSINVDELNADYSSVDGVLLNNAQTELIRYPQGKVGSYTIPGSVTSIWDYAFYECENLTSITIPNSMTSISFGAFVGCTDLISVIFQVTSEVTIIEASAFIDCQSLSSITIPDSVETIDSCAFSGCTGLKSITIGAGVTIGYSLLADVNNNFRDAYTAAGKSAGTYTAATYNGVWTKVVEPAVVNALALDTLVVAPVKDAAPDTTAINETQYSGAIAWFESDGTTPVAGNFAALTVYVAKVTLTAKAGYTLTGVAQDSFTYTGAAVTNAANSGEVTITFPATEVAPVTVTEISVKTPPTKITYTEGDTLDLTGLEVTLTKSDLSTEDVALAGFAAAGITTSPANGAALATTDTKVTITHTISGKSVDQNITVNAAPPTTYAVTIDGDAVETTDYTIVGAADLSAVVAGTELTITAVTDITVNGEEVAAGNTKKITITAATTITINKKAAPTIVGYFLDNDGTDTVLVTTDIVAYNTAEEAAKAGLSTAGFAKLSNGTYEAITIAWAFDEAYVGTTVGAKTVTGTVWPDTLPVSGAATTNQTGTVTVSEQEQTATPTITTEAQTVNTAIITIEGTAEANAAITITGGTEEVNGTADENGNFSIEVTLTVNQVNNLSVTAQVTGKTVSEAATVAITHETLVVNATINPVTGTFDKKEGAQANVTTTITWNSATNVTAVKNGDTPLTVNTDYTVVDNILTIKTSYLATLAVGKVALSIEFDQGETATLTIIINDTTPVVPNGTLLDANSGSDFTGVLYTRDSNIYYSQTNASGTWGTETLISAGGTEGRIVVDSNGNPHAAYTTDGKIGYRIYDGSVWTDEVLIESNNNGTCSKPDIAVDNNGKAYITYTDPKGDSDNYNEIMYATNSTGAFVKTIKYDGEFSDGSGNYYNKGSFIVVDSNDNYFIMSHRSEKRYNESGNYFSVVVTSSINKGGSTESNKTESNFDIYDLTSSGGKVVALYKHNDLNTAELTVDDTTISFTNTKTLTGDSVSSIATDGTNIVVGGISSGKLQTHYNGTLVVYDDIAVKGTKVSVVNIGGNFYAVYTDNSDNNIKMLQLIDEPA